MASRMKKMAKGGKCMAQGGKTNSQMMALGRNEAKLANQFGTGKKPEKK